MATPSVFDFVCLEIERNTSLGGPITRGTVRLALKEAGLSPESVDAAGMEVVVEKILPGELAAHQIAGTQEICDQLVQALATRQFGPIADRMSGAVSVLDRLGR